MACSARRGRRLAGLALTVALAGPAPGGASQVPATAAPQAQRFRLLRSTSGPSGVQRAGRYLVEDPRTAFSLEQDRQLVVHFEWEGPAGRHELRGTWRDPQGLMAQQSALALDAPQRRFGSFWTLLLAEHMAPGAWTLEVSIDGEPAGRHVVELQRGPRAVTAPSRRLLSPGEAYERLAASTAWLTALDAAGRPLRRGAAFSVEPGVVATAFQVVDGASTLRLSLPGGRSLETRHLQAWNRWQDWAVLALAEKADVPALPRAAGGGWSVGDHGFTLAQGEDGASVIVELSLAGRSSHPRAGERLSLAGGAPRESAGAPILDDYGELVGLLGGSTTPGDTWALGAPMSYLRAVGGLARATPVALLPASPGAGPVALEQLFAQGDFLPPVAGGALVGRALLGRGFDPSQPLGLSEEAYEFQRAGDMVVWVQWRSPEKLKGVAVARIFDLDGKTLAETQPGKLSLGQNKGAVTAWRIPLATREPGTYRLDVLLGEQPCWRTFFKVHE